MSPQSVSQACAAISGCADAKVVAECLSALDIINQSPAQERSAMMAEFGWALFERLLPAVLKKEGSGPSPQERSAVAALALEAPASELVFTVASALQEPVDLGHMWRFELTCEALRGVLTRNRRKPLVFFARALQLLDLRARDAVDDSAKGSKGAPATIVKFVQIAESVLGVSVEGGSEDAHTLQLKSKVSLTLLELLAPHVLGSKATADRSVLDTSDACCKHVLFETSTGERKTGKGRGSGAPSLDVLSRWLEPREGVDRDSDEQDDAIEVAPGIAVLFMLRKDVKNGLNVGLVGAKSLLSGCVATGSIAVMGAAIALTRELVSGAAASGRIGKEGLVVGEGLFQIVAGIMAGVPNLRMAALGIAEALVNAFEDSTAFCFLQNIVLRCHIPPLVGWALQRVKDCVMQQWPSVSASAPSRPGAFASSAVVRLLVGCVSSSQRRASERIDAALIAANALRYIALRERCLVESKRGAGAERFSPALRETARAAVSDMGTRAINESELARAEAKCGNFGAEQSRGKAGSVAIVAHRLDILADVCDATLAALAALDAPTTKAKGKPQIA